MNVLEDAALFLATVEAGSLSRAAKQSGVSQATASRSLQRLEQKLGVELLRRTTRHQELTTAGAFYADGMRSLLREAEDLARETAARGARLEGRLRLSLCSTFARHRLMPQLLAWSAAHKNVQLEVRLEEKRVDLVRDGIDIAVRAGRLKDTEYAATALGSYGHVLVCAPDYLCQYGAPKTPDELVHRDCLVMHVGKPLSRWLFVRDGTTQQVTVGANVLCTDAEGLLMAALCGRGITILPDYLIADSLESGHLVRLLEGFSVPDAQVWAMHGTPRRLPKLVRDALACLHTAARVPLAAHC